LSTPTVSNRTRTRALKLRHNIEVEFDLTINFGSAGDSLAFWAGPSRIGVRRRFEAESHLMFPSTPSFGGCIPATKAGGQMKHTPRAC
jgi:hypothetical protein